VDYTTLVKAINENKNSTELLNGEYFSESLKTNLKCISLIDTKLEENEEFENLIEFLLENLKIEGINISLESNNSTNFLNYCSYIIHLLLSKHYGLQNIYVGKGDTSHSFSKFKRTGSNKIIQVLHKNKHKIIKYTLFCEKASIM